MEKRTFTDTERVNIIKESEVNGVRITCDKYNLSTSVLYDWKQKGEVSATLPSATPKDVLSATPSTHKRKIGDVILGKGIECLGCGNILEAMYKPCSCGNKSHMSPNINSKGLLVSENTLHPSTNPQQ